MLYSTIAFFVLVRALSAFYVRVPPNKAAFFYGARSGKRAAIKLAPTDAAGTTVTVLPRLVPMKDLLPPRIGCLDWRDISCALNELKKLVLVDHGSRSIHRHAAPKQHHTALYDVLDE